MKSLSLNFQKWLQTMIISFSKHTAYRLDFFLQIIAPALVFFFINYSLWSSIYAGDPTTIIKGYNFTQMINYHVWVLIVGLVAQGHTSFNLAQDIRLGRISSYLIYPFNLWEFHTASFLSFEILQLFIGSFTFAILYSFGFAKFATINSLILGLIVSIVVSIFWFIVQYLMGLLSFWLDETWILRVMFRLLASFLSGVIIPLDLYPPTMVKILSYTPFPYLTYYPIKIFMGETQHVYTALGILGFWSIVFSFLCLYVWKKGLRLYTAAGM